MQQGCDFTNFGPPTHKIEGSKLILCGEKKHNLHHVGGRSFCFFFRTIIYSVII